MKVGILTGIYHPEQGGPATYLHRLHAELQQQGWGVEVITYGESPNQPNVHRVSRRQPIPFRLIAYAAAVARYARDADVWFVNDYGLVAATLRPLLRRPIVMKVVGDFAWESAVRRRLIPTPTAADLAAGDPLLDFQHSYHGPAVAVLKLVRTVGVKAAGRVIVPSEYLARVVASWGVSRDRITVIYNGVDVRDSANRSPTGRPTAVVAARLVSWKGVDHLLRAFRRVLDEVPDARLRILGDGPERAVLEALAGSLNLPADCVLFEGVVSPNEVRAAMAAGHVLVLPSAYEGLPHVVLEAFAEGCPVIAAASGGTPEVIDDDSDGILVPYGDEAALCAALVRVLADPERAKVMGARGRRQVEARFSWASTRDRTIALLMAFGNSVA